MAESFDLSFVDHDKARADDFREIDGAIDRLSARRQTKIEVAGPFLQSKLAWKVAIYQQAVLYRVVVLGRGVRTTWNARNVLAAVLLVRALTETVAVFDEFEHALTVALNREDIATIDQLVMNRTFATKDGELLKDHPEILAVNALTFIDKMQKRYNLPIRVHYDSLSERCHPNTAGHHQMFSTTDKANGTVTFTESKNLAANLDLIRAPLRLMSFFERAMDHMDKAITKVADVQQRLNPVWGNLN